MADVVIRGVTYQGVDSVTIPADGGGTESFIQPSGAITINDNGVVDVTDYASAVVNVSGGGGVSASDAILLVTAPANSVVIAERGGTTLTPTLWISAADPTLETALFVVEPSAFSSTAWTVTATLGTDTASDTIVIDSAAQYGLTLSYNAYLYKLGVESTLSGGWTLYTASGGSGSKESDHLHLGYSSSSNRMARYYTNNLVYFAGFAYLVADMIATAGTALRVGYSTSRSNSTSSDYTAYAAVSGAGSRELVKVPISTATDRGYYVELAASGGAIGDIYQVYLER